MNDIELDFRGHDGVNGNQKRRAGARGRTFRDHLGYSCFLIEGQKRAPGYGGVSRRLCAGGGHDKEAVAPSSGAGEIIVCSEKPVDADQ